MLKGTESSEELRAIEVECLRRFRAQAEQIKAANPTMAAKFCFCRAVESMPETSNKYAFVRAILLERGIAALPLR